MGIRNCEKVRQILWKPVDIPSTILDNYCKYSKMPEIETAKSLDCNLSQFQAS